MTDQGPNSTELTLSRKINRLFAVVHPRDAPERSTESVARQAGEILGRPVPPGYLARLRDGEFDDRDACAAADADILGAVARSFGVAADYLLTRGPAAEAIDRELELLATMRDANVASIALRGSNIDRAMLAKIIQSTEGSVPPSR
ncbi:hypothetical protein [Nocardia implantans]|uniref:XRE family transcriptional regulator n=1 Tax=Nocardia implantans TaxID=3108168 RepID=A0ABU6B1Y7_9NOCA|nr:MULTISPECIES: hypothetical protein [unclassified Nocardia]MBF6194911.1 hypothetical protein [Nocardia beijingensis]MEA3530431.1 hypothetical protein [Nocardia sp. CDC192]MEB3513709.1 hypothetical protein [Nocardia sp. CDC186]